MGVVPALMLWITVILITTVVCSWIVFRNDDKPPRSGRIGD